MAVTSDIVPDSERRGFIGSLPPRLRPFASLIRLDRPIGSWLLYWPCAWSVALAGVGGRWTLFLWLGLGAFAMAALAQDDQNSHALPIASVTCSQIAQVPAAYQAALIYYAAGYGDGLD